VVTIYSHVAPSTRRHRSLWIPALWGHNHHVRHFHETDGLVLHYNYASTLFSGSTLVVFGSMVHWLVICFIMVDYTVWLIFKQWYWEVHLELRQSWAITFCVLYVKAMKFAKISGGGNCPICPACDLMCSHKFSTSHYVIQCIT